METLERREVLTALYWDTNGATPGLGGNGDWDEVATNWTTDSAGASATQAWNSAAGDTAIFAGASGAVTLGAGISAAGLSFTANGYSIGSNALTLTGGAQVSLTAGIAATIASEIAGSAGLVKTGAGTLSLTSANTYSGVTTVSGGVLDIQHGSALGSTANGTVVANNAALQLQGGITVAGETLTIGGNGIGNTGALRNVSGDNTFTGAITTNTGVVSRIHSDSGSLHLSGGVHSPGGNSLYLSGAGNGVESGVISNLYQLVKEGTGTWTLSADNTYTTTTTIAGGTLQVGNGGGTGKLGSGNVVNNAQLVFNRTGAYTVANVISGTGSLTKNGSGVMTLSGNNTYGGVTTVNAGVLLVNHDSALGSSAAGTNVANGARVVLANGRNVASESITIAGNGGDYNGALQAGASATATWGGTVTLNSADARIGAGVNGALNVSGGILGNGAFQNLLIGAGVGGSGIVMLSAPSGSSTYTGSTGIVRGTLMMGAVNTLPAGTVLNVDTANAAEAATFDLNNFAQTIGGIIRTNTGGGAGAARVINSGGAAHTLTVNQTGETEFSGETKGKLNLTLIGDGTIAFSGAHNASGVTTVANGELHITETGSVGGTVIETGGTLTGPAAWYEITLSGMIRGETGGMSEGLLTLGTAGTNTLVVSAHDWLTNGRGVIRANVTGWANSSAHFGNYPGEYFDVNTVSALVSQVGASNNLLSQKKPDGTNLTPADKVIVWEDWTDDDWDDYFWVISEKAFTPTVTVTATDPNAAEAGSNTGTFTFTRTGSTASDLPVKYTLGGTADNSSDYTTLSGSVTILAGQSSAVVVVTPILDTTPEPSETVVLTLQEDAAYTFVTAGSTATATIAIAADNPVIEPIAAQETIEGRTVSLQIAATDPDDAANTLTYSATGLPLGLTMNNSGLIFGRVRYDAVAATGAVPVTVTATDPSGNPGSLTFNWTIKNADLTGVRAHEYSTVPLPLPNAIDVSGVTTTTIFVSPGNTVNLRSLFTTDAPMGRDVKFGYLMGGSVVSGTFETDPVVPVAANDNFTINVGLDVDLSGSASATEPRHSFIVRAVNILGATIHDGRIGGAGPVEFLFPVVADEHMEVGGTFQFDLVGAPAVGPNSMLRSMIWDADTDSYLLAYESLGNTSFNASWEASHAGRRIATFYIDKDNSGQWEPGEQYVDSPIFEVKQPTVYNLSVEVSDKIVGATTATISAAIRNGENMLLSRDSAEDFRAIVNFVPTITTFASTAAGGDAPDPAVGPAEMRKLSNRPSDLVFVSSLGGVLAGATFADDWSSVIVEWVATQDLLASTIIHEIGHGTGIGNEHITTANGEVITHINPDTGAPYEWPYLMSPAESIGTNRLSKTDVEGYESL